MEPSLTLSLQSDLQSALLQPQTEARQHEVLSQVRARRSNLAIVIYLHIYIDYISIGTEDSTWYMIDLSDFLTKYSSLIMLILVS